MKVKAFINQKARQLCYYLRAFWQGDLPFQELELFFWDTMEEWGQVSYRLNQPYSQKERVFWHLLHQMHFWHEDKLMYDNYLVEELANCMLYLEGKGLCPFDCVGIRP